MMNVCVYTDGSCLNNPGPGGWAAILRYGKHEKELVGGVDRTTNNRMELTAVIKGLQSLTRRCQVTIVTDSQYVSTLLNACTERSRSNGRAKANLDLVRQLRQLSQQHDIAVQLVRGHSGHEMNERCDQLARNEASQRKQTMVHATEAIACAA
ncbi:MAG: ribonuclease HI [Chloroflexi bacterium]|nr:ribonuclease HI [Chloroflexota bacterium]